MSSFPPPTGPSPSAARSGAEPSGRRPRYLVIALLGALLFGAGCWSEGCGQLSFYRGEREHISQLNASIKDDADRARAEALYQRFVETSDIARGRAVPMAAATFVLGAALLALGLFSLTGRSNTRRALMQVVAAQAALVAASYFVTRDVRNAELDWQFERSLIHQHEALPPEQYAEVVPMARSMRRWTPPAWLALRTVASALIILALSRQRAREFFEAAADPASGR